MNKPTSLFLCVLALVVLNLAGCASQPQTTATTQTKATDSSGSPLNRNQGNGLASYMH